MKQLAIALLVMAGAIECAHAADLSSAKASEPPKARNCFSSVWDWLNTSPSERALSYAGFTLYGTIDVGYGYNTAGVNFGEWYDKGVFYTIQKTSVGARWSWSSNALNASTVGVKMEEPIGGDWLLIGAAELNYNPYSLLPDNGPKSLTDNNLNPPRIRPPTATRAALVSGTIRWDSWASAAKPMAR